MLDVLLFYFLLKLHLKIFVTCCYIKKCLCCIYYSLCVIYVKSLNKFFKYSVIIKIFTYRYVHNKYFNRIKSRIK